MLQEKGLLKSKTFWGAFIALAPALDAIALALGVIATPLLGPIGTIITSATGATVAVHGRKKAKKRIRGFL